MSIFRFPVSCVVVAAAAFQVWMPPAAAALPIEADECAAQPEAGPLDRDMIVA